MKKKHLRGTALIEFALVLPALVIIIFGMVDYSILLFNKAVVTNASREGARYGIVLRTPSYASTVSIISYAKSYCSNYLITFNSTKPSVTVTAIPSTAIPTSGDQLTVVVSYPYTYFLMGNLLGLGTQITIKATTVMTYE